MKSSKEESGDEDKSDNRTESSDEDESDKGLKDLTATVGPAQSHRVQRLHLKEIPSSPSDPRPKKRMRLSLANPAQHSHNEGVRLTRKMA